MPNTSQLKETLIHTLCAMIQNSLTLYLNTIANQYGLDYYVVREIYRGRTWNHISKTYDFSKRKKLNDHHRC